MNSNINIVNKINTNNSVQLIQSNDFSWKEYKLNLSKTLLSNTILGYFITHYYFKT